MPNTLGIIGYGSFGKLLHELVSRFAPEVKAVVHSSRADASQDFYVSFEQAAACDVVIPCVPIHAFETTVAKILPYMEVKSVLVDVCTVKMHTAEILKRLLPGKRWLATHPMFGPESYEKKGREVEGLRIVLTEHTLQQIRYGEIVVFLKKCGFDVVEMSAKQHDKHLAETLFLAHFIGQSVARGKFDRTDIDTVSFGYLMDAVESVRQDEALFKDVYKFNPFCEEALRRFEASEAEVHALLQRPNGNGQHK